MTFFKNLFGRNKGKGQETAPVTPTPTPVPTPTPAPVPTPAQETVTPVVPAPVTPAVPNTKASDDIRRAIDTVTMKLFAMDDTGAQDIGRRLAALKLSVGDEPSAYKGFDASITKAIGQIEYFASTCGGDYSRVDGMITTLEEAIAARYLTEEACGDRFAPTMQTHYYQVMLIDLRGRLEKLDLDVDEKTIWRNNVMALPPEKQGPHMQALMACNSYLNAAVMQKNVLESYISNYEFAYDSALQQLSFDGELPPIDLEGLFGGIMTQTTQFERSFEAQQRRLIDFNTKFAAQAEASLVATARAEAAAKQQQQQQQQIMAMQEAAARNLSHLTGQASPLAPQAQAPAPQVQEPAVQEPAAQEPVAAEAAPEEMQSM